MILSPEQLRHAQMVLLYMMKRIHEACVKRGIHYWMAGGTLIGAVRHKGFIPWDDDLDICMMRHDYNKLPQIVQEELSDEFTWQDYHTDPNIPEYFGKVRLKNTLWLEEHKMDLGIREQGFYVDVFPVDYCPESDFRAKLVYNEALLFARAAYLKRRGISITSADSLKNFIMLLCSKLLPLKLSRWLYERVVMAPERYLRTSRCYEIGGNLHQLVPVETYEKFVLLPFEDTEFYAPENWDLRLKVQYGDYMTLPPPEERVAKHNIIQVDFGKY
ncbi:MAG: LicD family protein [Victivallales bacterium]|nr:LicD family protein [Victivallales bacterium]